MTATPSGRPVAASARPEPGVVPGDRGMAAAARERGGGVGPEALIAALRAAIHATLGPLLAGTSRVALIGFPANANVGDSAIWLGTLAYLRETGKTVCYMCAGDVYSRSALAARLGRGVILLAGGGNLGDVWPLPQALREQVVQDFPRTPIIQLPQSIHFEHAEALERARAILDAHPALTVLVRDRRSWDLARTHFRAPSMLCPDMAFALGQLERSDPPLYPVLWLARSDRERVLGPAPPSSVRPIDWLDEAPTPVLRAERWLRALLRSHPRAHRVLAGPLARVSAAAAGARLRRGCALLSRGRVVVTDRLHGHILSLLLGIPHVLLDNSYGKLRRFAETWTRDCPLVHFAADPVEAAAIAGEVAR